MMNENSLAIAEKLIREFKKDDYSFGQDATRSIDDYLERIGKRIVIITGQTGRRSGILEEVKASVKKKGFSLCGVFDGARPNAPREDVYRIAYQISRSQPDGVVSIGGGSCIDASKAALVLYKHGGTIDEYFGADMVSAKSKGKQIPLISIQTSSGSASHLTKYSNVTDMTTFQKKLIVDKSIIPRASIFPYNVTSSMPTSLTKDGALDGITHCWEVWTGATNKDYYPRISEVAYSGIKLIVENLPLALDNADNIQARRALGLGTDLGGYAIMLGGTNGPHLGSFSLVDLLAHGRSCAILNPYYTILFSNAIQEQLKTVADIYIECGFLSPQVKELSGRNLGESVAKAMMKFSRSIDYPITLEEAGVTQKHIDKMIEAASNPQLEMKLNNMPIPMSTRLGDIERLMKPTLEAAYTGNLDLIPTS